MASQVVQVLVRSNTTPPGVGGYDEAQAATERDLGVLAGRLDSGWQVVGISFVGEAFDLVGGPTSPSYGAMGKMMPTTAFFLRDPG